MFFLIEKVTFILGCEVKLGFPPQHRNTGPMMALSGVTCPLWGILVGVAVQGYFPHTVVWVTFVPERRKAKSTV